MQSRNLLLGILLGLVLGVLAEELVRVPAIKKEKVRLRSVFQMAVPSFAQQGEDLVLFGIFRHLKIKKPTYLDVGAWEPILRNNTFFFYWIGSKGVLVEPNPHYNKMLREKRPRDTVLQAGIGVTAQKFANYYVMRGNSEINTFSKKQVEVYQKKYGKNSLEKVIKMPLLNINDVIKRHFGGKAPDLVSIDVEGLDLPILKTFDFKTYRPAVFCIETLRFGTKQMRTNIVDWMKKNGYEVRGGTFVNTIFVDKQRLK